MLPSLQHVSLIPLSYFVLHIFSLPFSVPKIDLVALTGQPNTLGTALNQILPTVFPSRRNPVLAVPVLHGAVVPMSAPVEELMRAAAFADGFLHVVVAML